MSRLENHTADAVSRSNNASQDLLSLGMHLLGADRLGTIALLGDQSKTGGKFLSQMLSGLPESKNLRFGDSEGVRASYDRVRSTISDLHSHSKALESTLRPSFSDFRDLKHLVANAMVAASENLRLNTGSSRQRSEVYHEGAEERSSAQLIARALEQHVVTIQKSTPPDPAALVALARQLPGAASTLLSHVRDGQYCINHGIEKAVKGLAVATAKLHGTISLIDGSQEISDLDWNRVREDCSAFLTATKHPVLDRVERPSLSY